MSSSDFLRTNYHTHTFRCGHAEGTDEDYVLAALKRDMKALGFSDHIFYPKEEEYVCNSRMMFSAAPEYIRSIQALKAKYEGRLQLYVGFEMDYIPYYYEREITELKQLGIDYLILGQHSIGDELNGIYAGAATEDPVILHQYVELIVQGLGKGIFSCVAHPDIIHFCGDKKIFESEIDRICEAAKREAVPLEMNLHGMELGRQYPNEFFWRVVKEHNNSVIFGIDAHSSKSILDREGYEKCVRLAEQLQLEIVDTIDTTKWQKRMKTEK